MGNLKDYKGMLAGRGRVYLASPFFNDEQVERVNAVKQILKEEGFTVFSPKDECICKPNANANDRKCIFNSNVEAINKASFILAITDGKDPGTLFETGVAYSSGINAIYFAETLGDKPFNLMLAQSAVHTVKSRDELRQALNNKGVLGCLLSHYHEQYNDFEGEIE